MYLGLLRNMKEGNALDRVLISQDAGWYTVGQEGGGGFRGYAYLLKTFVPAMLDAGFTEDEVEMLLVTNPAKAFAIGVREGFEGP